MITRSADRLSQLLAPSLVAIAVLLAALISAQPAAAQSAPADPTGLTATHNGSTVTATWTADSNATKYHVSYSSDGMNSWSGPSCGDSCTGTTITFNADPAKTYVVGLRAGNDSGWSNWVNSAPAAPPNPPPAAPASVTVARSNGTLTASWDAPAGSPTKYHITYSVNGHWNWTAASDNHTSTSITISGVDNNTTYVVGVRAGNATGWGGWTNSDSIAPIYAPGQVGSLSATRSGTGISVSWSAPANNGGSAVTSYDVNYSTDDGYSWTRYASTQTETSATIANASNAVDYIVAVRANNGVGGGAWTNSSTVAGLAAPAFVGAYKNDGDGSYFIDVGWAAVAGASGYDVNIILTVNNLPYQYSEATNVTGTSYRINNAGYYQPYQYVVAVRARNASGPGPWTNSPPAAATRSLAASSVTATGATLTASPYTGAWYYQADAGPDSACQGPVSAAGKNLSGLTPGTEYTYTAYSDSACSTAIVVAPAFTTDGVSVSNLDELSHAHPNFVTTTKRWATAFTTGGNSTGYTLHSAALPLTKNAAATLTITIHTGKTSGSNVVPSDTVVATLTTGSVNQDTTTNVANICTASQTNSCELDGDTTYFVVVTVTGNNGQATWRYTTSFDETLVPSGNGWSIAQGWYSDYSNSAWGAWTTYATNDINDVNKVKIAAIPNPALTVTSIGSTAATLNVANHTGSWYYQESHPSSGTCTGVSDSTTKTLALTADKTYAYAAYSDSTCSTALGEPVYFSTTDVSVGNLGHGLYYNRILRQRVRYRGTAGDGVHRRQRPLRRLHADQRDAQVERGPGLPGQCRRRAARRVR